MCDACACRCNIINKSKYNFSEIAMPYQNADRERPPNINTGEISTRNMLIELLRGAGVGLILPIYIYIRYVRVVICGPVPGLRKCKRHKSSAAKLTCKKCQANEGGKVHVQPGTPPLLAPPLFLVQVES